MGTQRCGTGHRIPGDTTRYEPSRVTQCFPPVVEVYDKMVFIKTAFDWYMDEQFLRFFSYECIYVTTELRLTFHRYYY